jgi:hypothetical protein
MSPATASDAHGASQHFSVPVLAVSGGHRHPSGVLYLQLWIQVRTVGPSYPAQPTLPARDRQTPGNAVNPSAPAIASALLIRSS